MFEKGENQKTMLSHEPQIWMIVHCIIAIWKTVQGTYSESAPEHQVFAQLEIKQYCDL